MSRDRSLSEASIRLSWLLRHGAREADLAMDAAGWAAIEDVLIAGRLDRALLDRVVAGNNKQRYQLDGDRIRAVQGHSLTGTPVTLDGLEASWRRVEPDAPVFHGTRVEALEPIGRAGLLPGERSHVHLAPARDAVVGKRAEGEVLLEVSPTALRAAGLALFVAPNGVVLARHVPPRCIVDLHPCTPATTAALPELRALLGLP